MTRREQVNEIKRRARVISRATKGRMMLADRHDVAGAVFSMAWDGLLDVEKKF